MASNLSGDERLKKAQEEAKQLEEKLTAINIERKKQLELFTQKSQLDDKIKMFASSLPSVKKQLEIAVMADNATLLQIMIDNHSYNIVAILREILIFTPLTPSLLNVISMAIRRAGNDSFQQDARSNNNDPLLSLFLSHLHMCTKNDCIDCILSENEKIAVIKEYLNKLTDNDITRLITADIYIEGKGMFSLIPAIHKIYPKHDYAPKKELMQLLLPRVLPAARLLYVSKWLHNTDHFLVGMALELGWVEIADIMYNDIQDYYNPNHGGKLQPLIFRVAENDTMLELLAVYLLKKKAIITQQQANFMLVKALKASNVKLVALAVALGAEIKQQAQFSEYAVENTTALILAAEYASVECGAFLLRKGAKDSINYANDNQSGDYCGTALITALKRGSDKTETANWVKLLLRNGANPNSQIVFDNDNDNDNDNEDEIPLLLAAQHSAEAFRNLLAGGVKVRSNITDSCENNFITYGLYNKEVINYCLRNKQQYDFLHTNEYRENLLYFAIFEPLSDDLRDLPAGEIIEKIDFLIKQGVAINAQDANEKTVLYHAIDKQVSATIVAHLLNCNADVNLVNDLGLTVLMRAVLDFDSAKLAEHTSRINLLLRHGARLDIRDGDGETALDMAQRLNQPIVAAMLQQIQLVNMQPRQVLFLGKRARSYKQSLPNKKPKLFEDNGVMAMDVTDTVVTDLPKRAFEKVLADIVAPDPSKKARLQ